MPENRRNTRRGNAIHFRPLSAFVTSSAQPEPTRLACGKPAERRRYVSISTAPDWYGEPEKSPSCEDCVAAPSFKDELRIIVAEKTAADGGKAPLYACAGCTFTASAFWDWHLHHHAAKHRIDWGRSSVPAVVAERPELCPPELGAKEPADKAIPYEDRRERLEDAAREANNLVSSVEDLATWSGDAGEDELAAVFRDIGEHASPLARLLEAIQEHAEKGGQGLPPEIADFLTGGGAENEDDDSKRAPLTAGELARKVGVPTATVELLGKMYQHATAPAGAAWRAEQDAERLANSLQVAAQKLAGHKLCAEAFLPERLALMAAQARQGAQALIMARQLALHPQDEPIPEDLRPLVSPFLVGRMAVLSGDRPRCQVCGCLMLSGRGAEPGPLVCSRCLKPEAECTCVVVDEQRDQVLAGDVDSAAVIVTALAEVWRRAAGRALELPAGDPVRLMVEGLGKRIERLAMHLARLAGALPGTEDGPAEQAEAPSLAGALVNLEQSAAEFSRAAELVSRLAGGGLTISPVVNATAERARAEAVGAALLRQVVTAADELHSAPGAGGVQASPRELDERHQRLINATARGDAPLGFLEDLGSTREQLGRLLRRGAQLVGRVGAVAREGAALAQENPRACRWRLPEILSALATRCEGHVLVFRSLARFDSLPEFLDAPPVVASMAQDHLGPELMQAPELSRLSAQPEEADKLRQVLAALGWHLEGKEPGPLGEWSARRLVERAEVWLSDSDAGGLVSQAERFNAALGASGQVSP
jgi:hypothetical protein